MTQCPLLIVHVRSLQLEDPIFEPPISPPPYYRPSIAVPSIETLLKFNRLSCGYSGGGLLCRELQHQVRNPDEKSPFNVRSKEYAQASQGAPYRKQLVPPPTEQVFNNNSQQ